MQASELDRDTARALVEAGYMPLDDYVRMFSSQPTSPPRRSAAVDSVLAASAGVRSARGGRMKATLRPAVGWRATYR